MTGSNEALMLHLEDYQNTKTLLDSQLSPGTLMIFQEGGNLRTKKSSMVCEQWSFLSLSKESQKEALGWQRNSSSKSLARTQKTLKEIFNS